MSSNEIINIIGIGARTTIGATAPLTASAVRAGINCFAEHPYMIDKIGEPMIVAMDNELSEELLGIERFLQLATPAAQEALTPLKQSNPNITLIIGLPPKRIGLPAHLATEIAQQLPNKIKCTFDQIKTIAGGHASALLAIEQAIQIIQQNPAQLCLIGGVDSYLQPETLEWLDYNQHLHSTANRYGFIPGEAAGFCLLASQQTVHQLSLKPLAQILAVASTQEKNCINTDTVCIGEGLSAAFSNVFQTLKPSNRQIEQIFCDLNGERYRADEYGFSVLRTREFFVDPGKFMAPADCWGDVGAATGALLINLITTAAAKGYAQGELSLLWASSESGERSAALLQAQPLIKE
ncbi:hypothetical protein PN36_21285 [Candidatus Thiomargarita nelsonii]|uniref:Beta-ketoacyl synthase-like N-terminal domain-containing protein n=1 Tax=Candidatus Thiomargarita nelsonii TaxID=1003181 RepID=A0A4E0QPJ2_9GAMM|nr:hypothetical protein PN36_21285 [Candidatus Thiomargarita nelsonii]